MKILHHKCDQEKEALRNEIKILQTKYKELLTKSNMVNKKLPIPPKILVPHTKDDGSIIMVPYDARKYKG